MAYSFPEGAAFYFASTFASAKTISAVTNANPALATSTAHGYTDLDEVLFTSGWEDATDTVYRIDQQSADTFTLTGLNATDTNFFATGSGTGTTQKVSAWTAIPQVLSIATSGGDPRFTTIAPLARRNNLNVPTGFNASSVTLTLGYDSTNANFQTMLGISRGLTKVAFKQSLAGGATTYGYGYMAVSEFPTLNNNQPATVQVALSLIGRPISY
jgi:hypothetical protein